MKIRILDTVKGHATSLLNRIGFWISIWLLVVAIIWLIVLLAVSPQITNAITATATLTLALAAFLTIWHSNQQENRRRRENLLNEIIEWATDTGACILKTGTPQKEEKIRRVITTTSMAQLYLESRFDMAEDLSPLRMRSVYINEISKMDSSIRERIEDSTEYLRHKLRLTHRYLENKDIIYQKNGAIKAAINVAKNEYELYDSIVDLIKEVGEIKSFKGDSEVQEVI